MIKQKRTIFYQFIIILFCFIITGCSGLQFEQIQDYRHHGNAIALLSSSLSGTPTPTPFMPLDPTPTYIPTAIPTPQPTPEPPKESTSVGNVKPAGTLEIPKDLINILVLGSDQRPNDGGFRTDAIILVSINKKTKTASMVSFPRDLYVYVPGFSYQRINTAMFYGGYNLIGQTLEYNFGIKPSFYVMVNFQAFQDIIDHLGGVEVEVASTFKDIFLDGNYKRIPAGPFHMDGETALWYARSRQTSNDFDRTRRQQEVLHAVTKRVLKADALENAKKFFEIYKDNVATNLQWGDIATIISLSVYLKDPSHIQRYMIGPGDVYDWITPGGAMVLVPRQEMIIGVLNQALGNK